MKIAESIIKWSKLVRLLTLLIFLGSMISLMIFIIMSFRIKTEQLTRNMDANSQGVSKVVVEFVGPVTNFLRTMHQWGQTGKLDLDNPTDLALMIVPLLDTKPMTPIAGVSIADKRGRNLFLNWPDNKWTAAFTSKGTTVFYDIHDGRIKELGKKSNNYDHSKRLWFSQVSEPGVREGEILWSAPHLFYSRKEMGVTASVKSILRPKKDNDFQVIACDLLLADMKSALESVIPANGTVLFLMTQTGSVSNMAAVLNHDIGQAMASSSRMPAQEISADMKQEFLSEMNRGQQGKNTVFRFKEDGRPWWGSISPGLTEAGITRLCIAMPESVLVTGIKPVTQTVFILFFSLLALASFLLTLVAWKYGRRLEMIPGRQSFITASSDRIQDLIDGGENKELEFKSTLRWNMKTQKKGKEIELASLKTIVAFMNSEGGTLLVGIGDDGTILGLEPDGFENDDKILLHFNSLFAQHIGLEFSGNISFDLKEVSAKKILVVDSQKSDEPVFLKNKGSEEFYIRVGPGSRRLLTSEVIEYLKTRGK